MDKKYNINIFKWGMVMISLLLIAVTTLLLMEPVFAQGQETCPNSGGWIKIDGLSGTSFTYTAPEGKLISETCYKAGTSVIYKTISPPQKSVTVTSTVGHDLSHASFRLVNEPDPSPTPTDEPTPSPTPTDEPTPSPTPTDEPTPNPTPTDEPTPSPTPTDEPTPSPTPTDEPTPSPTPTDEFDFIPLSLIGVCSGSVASLGSFQASEETITWTVTNENNVAISFNWSANSVKSLHKK